MASIKVSSPPPPSLSLFLQLVLIGNVHVPPSSAKESYLVTSPPVQALLFYRAPDQITRFLSTVIPLPLFFLLGKKEMGDDVDPHLD